MEITAAHLAIALILIAVSFAAGPKIFGEVVTLVTFGTSWLIFAIVFSPDVATINVGGVFAGAVFGYVSYLIVERTKSIGQIDRLLSYTPSNEAADRVMTSLPAHIALPAMVIGGYLVANLITILSLRDPLFGVLMADGTLVSILGLAVWADKKSTADGAPSGSVIAALLIMFIAIPLCITALENHIAP